MQKRVEEIARKLLAQPVADRDMYLETACDSDAALMLAVREEVKRIEAGGQSTAEMPRESDVPTLVSANASLEGPGTMLGQYKILQLIGEGGFGQVFMAQQSHPVKRKVALKVVKPGMDSKAEDSSTAATKSPRLALVSTISPAYSRAAVRATWFDFGDSKVRRMVCTN